MGKIIILEGPDGVGKTTAARSLEKLGFHYEHDGVPDPGRDNISYYLAVLDEAINAKHNTVFDRLWFGERIYGPIARERDTIGEEGQKLFMRLHNSKDITMFICSPQIDIAQSNYEAKIKDSGDYLKSIEKWQRVYRAYRSAAFEHDSFYIYDYTLHSIETLLALSPSLYDVLPKGTVGSLAAKYLFIGDVPNHDSIDVPFHSLGGSSAYFNSALERAGIKEDDLALSNAFAPGGELHSLKDTVRNLRYLENIILLGNKANDWYRKEIISCKNVCWAIDTIPHPSFLKRFRGNNPEVMADLIRRIVRGSLNSR